VLLCAGAGQPLDCAAARPPQQGGHRECAVSQGLAYSIQHPRYMFGAGYYAVTAHWHMWTSSCIIDHAQLCVTGSSEGRVATCSGLCGLCTADRCLAGGTTQLPCYPCSCLHLGMIRQTVHYCLPPSTCCYHACCRCSSQWVCALPPDDHRAYCGVQLPPLHLFISCVHPACCCS
jgi:hypothetical protein